MTGACPAPQGIGDIKSKERGSGARFNTGKPDLFLIPLNIIADTLEPLAGDTEAEGLVRALRRLGRFQVTGRVEHLDAAIKAMAFAWRDAALVFTYGTGKYAPWNWAKGMAWSVPISCAARHTLNVVWDGEYLDAESGQKHAGHILCNLVMLRAYIDSYPEGNDLPDPALFARA